MFLWLIHQGVLTEVHLEFMIPGHSYMPCDRTFGTLEKKFKKLENINCPEEYINQIRRSPKSTTKVMEYTDFLDFKFLLAFIQFRKAKGVLFSKSRRIILDKDEPWSMLLITPTGNERVDLNKRENRKENLSLPELIAKHRPDPSGNEDIVRLPKKYKEDTHLILPPLKLLHLKQMSPYLNSAGRTWVDKVTIGQRTAVPRPRLTVDDEHTQDSTETLPADFYDDVYTSVPEPNFPPGYVENIPLEDPPPHPQASTSTVETPSHSQASTSTPSSSKKRAKRRLPQTPASKSKRPKATHHDKEPNDTDSD